MRILRCRVIQNWDWLSFNLQEKPRRWYFSPLVMQSFNKQLNRPTLQTTPSSEYLMNQPINHYQYILLILIWTPFKARKMCSSYANYDNKQVYSINQFYYLSILCNVFRNQIFDMTGKCVCCWGMFYCKNPMQTYQHRLLFFQIVCEKYLW